MPNTMPKIPAITGVYIQGIYYVGVEGFPWPNGPTLRVRDIWRDREAGDTNSTVRRAVVLEILPSSGGWVELASHTYADLTVSDDEKVITLGATFGRRHDRRKQLIEQAKSRAAEMREYLF